MLCLVRHVPRSSRFQWTRVLGGSSRQKLPVTPPCSINASPSRRRRLTSRFDPPLTICRRSLRTSRNNSSTIFALSTAPGRSAIAIIRCSGPASLDIYRTLCPEKPLPIPRKATLRTLYDSNGSTASPQVLDAGALILYFPAPRTVTGEDILEFHVHGGPAIVKAVLSAISRVGSESDVASTTVRYAEPGEFTRRAFYNDRLDLTQIEALGDSLAAETEQQRRLAVRGTSNVLTQRYEKWRSLLLHARGELEALIDFSEDQHFDDSPTQLTSSVAAQSRLLRSKIAASIDNASKGELLRSGIDIALLGAPNAGKSSLLNRIVGREAAIVSPEAGTTRDVVEINVDIGGFFCKFGDLAGLRGASTPSSELDPVGAVEQEGIRRAKMRALDSDVVIVVLSLEPDPGSPGQYCVKLDQEVQATLEQLDHKRQRIIYVVNKMDLSPYREHESRFQASQSPLFECPATLPSSPIHHVSCLPSSKFGNGRVPLSTPARPDRIEHTNRSNTIDPTGLQQFLGGLTAAFCEMTSASDVDGALTGHISGWKESLGASERQRLLLKECLDHLDLFQTLVPQEATHSPESKDESTQLNSEVDIVLAAESLRAAGDCLARITGKGESGDVEEVLGVVFEKFCVGK